MTVDPNAEFPPSAGFPSNVSPEAPELDKPVVEGVREITQSPFYDPDIDDEDEMEETR